MKEWLNLCPVGWQKTLHINLFKELTLPDPALFSNWVK